MRLFVFFVLLLFVSCKSTVNNEEQETKAIVNPVKTELKSKNDIFSLCGLELREMNQEIVKSTMSCIPFTKRGSFLMINYEVFVTGQLDIRTTLNKSISTLSFDATATPAIILSQAKKDLNKHVGQVISKFVSLDERIEVSKMDNSWRGILCTVQPVYQLESTLGGEHVVTEFSPPLPGLLSPIAGKPIYEKEIPDTLVWDKIEAKIISSTNSAFAVGQKIEGSVTISRISEVLVFLVIFRSFAWSILAMIPNIFPLLSIVGIMGMFDITVENNVVILICIIIGIAVDDTIHFLYSFRCCLEQEKDFTKALSLAYSKTAKQITLTTFSFILTLPCLFLTTLVIFNQIAFLLMLSLFLALVADLFLLPALVCTFYLRK